MENERYTYCTRSLGEASLSTYCKVSMSYTGGNCVPIDCHPLELYTRYIYVYTLTLRSLVRATDVDYSLVRITPRALVD